MKALYQLWSQQADDAKAERQAFVEKMALKTTVPCVFLRFMDPSAGMDYHHISSSLNRSVPEAQSPPPLSHAHHTPYCALLAADPSRDAGGSVPY